MKVSVVIPTYSNYEGLVNCVNSILVHTDMNETEIVIVANGAPTEVRAILSDNPKADIKLLWYDEPIGYTKATNRGIEAAGGSYIVLLNDDCVVLGPQWIQLLIDPFLSDPTMAATGPLMLHCPDADRDFLVFCCVMISRAAFDALGILDEIFSPGYGEDADFCARAADAGWKVERVPSGSELTLIDKGCEDLPQWKRDKMWHAQYPLYHSGNETFGKDPERFEVVLRKNKLILQERYRMPKLNLDRAKVIDGWFAESELEFVAEQAKHCKVIVEIGSWHGRSSRGIADNLPEGGVLYCCDTWNGSSGEPEMHGSAKLREGDHAHSWWWCNMHDLIVAGKVIPVRMSSHNAAITLKHMGVVADMIFIDADHSYEGVRDDIMSWRGLMKEGGLWCGHDYYLEGQEPFAWMGVRQCVNEMFPDVQQALGTSIWHSRSKPLVKSITIDCLIADTDLDAIENRFKATDALVDRWIVIEGKQTREGEWKPLAFAENIARFQPWLHKITHISGFEFKGNVNDPQAAEDQMWDATTIGMGDCKDEDVIVLDGVGSPDLVCKVTHKEVRESSPSVARNKWKSLAYQVASQCDDPEYAKVVERSQRALLSQWFNDVPRDAGIIDVGCGDGTAMRILREMGFTDVNGVDLIGKGERVLAGDMHSLFYSDNSVDYIWCSHALEHAYDPVKALAEFKRVLKPDGKLFLVLPYPDVIDSEHRAKAHCGSEVLGLTDALSVKTLLTTVESAGFTNTYREQGNLRGEPEIYLQFDVARPRVFDTFIYNDEEEVLAIRLATLNEVVDRFVLVEGTLTHSGKPKPLHFDLNKDRYAPYLHKITHVIVDDYPNVEGLNIYDQAWTRERHQRDSIMHGLRDARLDDIVLVGDADEIANPDAIRNYDVQMGLCRLKQRLFYYYLNCENKEGWDWLKIAPYSIVKALTPCGVRYPPAGHTPLIENGGNHFSFLGGAAAAIKKVGDYAHREMDTPELMDFDRVTKLINAGEDIFGRGDKYEFVDIDENYPEYIKDRINELTAKGFIKVNGPSWPNPLILPTDMSVAEEMDAVEKWVERGNNLATKKHWTVTACVSTLNRYETTLPMCLTAIITQTRKPDKLVIYDDGDLTPEQLIEKSPFKGLFQMCDALEIPWEIFSTPKQGQVTNHQHCLDNADTDFIWRVDDDEVPMSDCLERLLNTVRDHGRGGEFEKIGAVSGLVLHPDNISAPPDFLDGSLKDIACGLNLSWFRFNGGPREVQHLYSTFLFRTEHARKVGGYPKNLSVVGHSEESVLTHLLYRAGYLLLIDPAAITYHLREATGGIRSFPDLTLWQHDEQVWQSYLTEWGAGNAKPTKILNCDFGRGDHFVLMGVLPKLKELHADKEIILAACFPDILEPAGLKMISIADHRNMMGERYDEALLYRYLWEKDWKGSLADGMLEFWK